MAFRRRLGTNTTWYIQHGTCSPIWNGIGSGKALSLILLIVGHEATGGGFYSGNGRTSSSLTGLTSGLPISVTATQPEIAILRQRLVQIGRASCRERV